MSLLIHVPAIANNSVSENIISQRAKGGAFSREYLQLQEMCRDWVNQSCTRARARRWRDNVVGSSDVGRSANKIIERGTAASSGGRDEPGVRAQRRRSQTEWQITKSIFKFPARRGVQLENSISATDETSAPIVPTTFFSPTRRPVPYPAWLTREIALVPSATSRPGRPSGFWSAPGLISGQPINVQLGVLNVHLVGLAPVADKGKTPIREIGKRVTTSAIRPLKSYISLLYDASIEYYCVFTYIRIPRHGYSEQIENPQFSRNKAGTKHKAHYHIRRNYCAWIKKEMLRGTVVAIQYREINFRGSTGRFR